MGKITEKEAKKLIEDTKKKYGSELHYMLLVYHDGEQIKWTQDLETKHPEMLVGIFERIKSTIINSLNQPIGFRTISKEKKKR